VPGNARQRVTPSGSAAAIICAAMSSVIAECSMSMKMLSKPQVSATIAISAVREKRTAMHSTTSPRPMRSLTRLLTEAGTASPGKCDGIIAERVRRRLCSPRRDFPFRT